MSWPLAPGRGGQCGSLDGHSADRCSDRAYDAFTSNILHVDARSGRYGGVLRSGELARARGLRPTVGPPTSETRPAEVSHGGEAGRANSHGGAHIIAACLRVCGAALGPPRYKDVEGRVLAFDEVRTNQWPEPRRPKRTRGSKITFVADRLRLSADNVALLLKEGRRPRPGRGRGRSGGGPGRAQRRARHRRGRRFWALVYSVARPP